MPVQPPSYEVPTFPPTGNAEIDNALTQWTQQFGKQYREGQEALQRVPFIVSTFSNESTNNPKLNYISKSVGLMGGEQVQVGGFFLFRISAGVTHSSAGSVQIAEAFGRLKVTYPGGTTLSFSTNQAARLRVSAQGTKSSAVGNVRTTVAETAMVSFTWPIEARFQTGGEHTFTLYTAGDGVIEAGTLTVTVL